MDYAEVARQIDAAGNALKAAAKAMGDTPPPDGAITTPAELDAALAKADPGASLLLAPTLVYPSPFTISKPVVLHNAGLTLLGRASLSSPMPSFLGGVAVLADDVGLFDLEMRHTDPLTDICVLTGANAWLDGCRVLGDKVKGAKRGIAGNASNVRVLRCYVEDCFQFSPGNDSQAFAAWNSPGPFLLEDNYLSGGSETVLFGGADPQNAAHIPHDIVIRRNTITKRKEWQTQNIGVKNTLELKNAINVLVEDNDIEYCWGGHGQDGYLLMITPRNQDGMAPFSTVKHVIIRNNRLRHAAAAIAMLGHDAPNTSMPLEDLLIEDNEVIDIDPWAYAGSDKMIFVGDGPMNVTIQKNKFAGQHIGSQVYLSGAPKAFNLRVTDNTWPTSEYGVFGAGCAPGGTTGPTNNAWQTFVDGPNNALEGNITV